MDCPGGCVPRCAPSGLAGSHLHYPVSDGTNNATCGYLANSALVDSIVFKQNCTTRMVSPKRRKVQISPLTDSRHNIAAEILNY